MPAMHFDLSTLYVLAIGTLLVSAAMTLWERHAHPQGRCALGTLAAGYATLAAGCAAAICRSAWPGVLGSALSNLAIVAGYLLILEGVAVLGGRRRRAAALALLAAVALLWAIGGSRWPTELWTYGGAVPIALASGLTAWEALRSERMRPLRSRRVVAAVTAGHALFYAARFLVLPLLAAWQGSAIVATFGRITLYEGVLYSVGLPMALLALMREDAHRQLLAISRTDYLTGLGNRQWFFEEGARMIGGRGAGRPLSLLAFDLDRFKTINDRYGHATGDEVLRSFALIARTTLGPAAILARIGGEEFAALLPDHDRRQATEAGQAVADLFADATAYGDDGIGVKATVSIGLAEFRSEAKDLAGLMSAADRALYVAKALGRNRIEWTEPRAEPAMV